MEIIFRNPIYLWFLFSIPLLAASHFITLSNVRGRLLQFANFTAMARVTGMQPQQKNLLLLFSRIFILLFIVFAVSGTVVRYVGKTSENDFVLAVDTSSSMLADDLKPNRIEAAKEATFLFADTAPPKTRAALISFSGTSFVKQTLTDDMNLLKEKISAIGVEPIGGTDLGDAIATGTNLLLSSEGGKVIVLLTDGRSNVGMSPLQAVDYANENNVNIYTIGIGTEEGGMPEGSNITLTLDETALKIIANETSGGYYRAESKEELENAYKKIASSTNKKLSVDLTIYLMLLALLLIFLEWGLVITRYRRIP